MWRIVKRLRPHPLSVGQARNFCTRRLTSVLGDAAGDEELDEALDDLVADAATIASELVTNAVTAGSSAIELVLGLCDSRLRIEVGDDAAGSVVPARPGADDPKGRGLLIVAALAREWGVTAADGTKYVWAELELPARPAASPGLA